MLAPPNPARPAAAAGHALDAHPLHATRLTPPFGAEPSSLVVVAAWLGSGLPAEAGGLFRQHATAPPTWPPAAIPGTHRALLDASSTTLHHHHHAAAGHVPALLMLYPPLQHTPSHSQPQRASSSLAAREAERRHHPGGQGNKPHSSPLAVAGALAAAGGIEAEPASVASPAPGACQLLAACSSSRLWCIASNRSKT